MRNTLKLLAGLSLLFLLGNCSKDADGNPEPDPIDRSGNLLTTGESAEDLLGNANFDELVIQIAYVEGFRPSDLALADPANAARYQANFAAFEQRLAQLDARLKPQLQGLAGKPYFVFHEAYDYFEAAYGLKHAGVFSVLGEVQPGAQHVAAMRERLQAAGPTCVFSEPPMRPRLAQTLTAGLPVTLAELDAMGAGLPADARGYERLLSNLGDELVSCLGAL